MFPALSPDGERLAFAATDGEQDTTTDLWMSQWMQNHWSAPYRFDGFEQSPSSEITPCFLGRDSLLFASDGFGGKGGFDLFVTVEHAGTWTSPVPLEELNSAADDRDVCVLPNGDLLFASNRAGTFDLYYAQRRKKGALSRKRPLRNLAKASGQNIGLLGSDTVANENCFCAPSTRNSGNRDTDRCG